MATATLDEAPAEAAVTSAPTRRDRLAIPSLVAATTVSNVGNQMTAIAVPWFVLVTTGSAARTGIVAAAVAVATTLGGFFGGTVVDRIGFKRVSIVSDLASGFFVAMVPTLYYLDMLTFPALIALTFFASLLDAPGWSARRAMLPDLAERSGTSLERSNSLIEIATAVASFGGPLLAGVLISALSAAAVLYLDTASFAISAGIIALAIAMPHVWKRAVGANGEPHPSFFHEATEGVRFISSQPLLRGMMSVGVVANLIFTPMFGVAVPVYAKQTFDDPRAYGVMIAGFGIGALASVIAYSAVGTRIPRYPVFVGGIIFGALNLWLFPTTSYLAVCVVGAVAMGIGLGPLNVISMTVVQEIVPRELLGRVTGVIGALSQVAAPVGLLIAGLAIEWLGVRPVMYFCAAAFTLLVAAAVTMPVFRQVERPHPPTPSPVATGEGG